MSITQIYGCSRRKTQTSGWYFKQIKAQQQNNYAITDFTADNKAVKLGSFVFEIVLIHASM